MVLQYTHAVVTSLINAGVTKFYNVLFIYLIANKCIQRNLIVLLTFKAFFRIYFRQAKTNRYIKLCSGFITSLKKRGGRSVGNIFYFELVI